MSFSYFHFAKLCLELWGVLWLGSGFVLCFFFLLLMKGGKKMRSGSAGNSSLAEQTGSGQEGSVTECGWSRDTSWADPPES